MFSVSVWKKKEGICEEEGGRGELSAKRTKICSMRFQRRDTTGMSLLVRIVIIQDRHNIARGAARAEGLEKNITHNENEQNRVGSECCLGDRESCAKAVRSIHSTMPRSELLLLLLLL